MAKLFQAFSQIDSSLARKFEGTGLGLAMVKQLAELHGGTVAVASAEGEGARFVAWLPLRTRAPHAAAPRPDGEGASVAAAVRYEGRVALVVEDDDRAADLVRLLLEAEGFTVVRAASAEAALVLAPRQTLSLITLDVQLPGIDGWEFLAAHPRGPTPSRRCQSSSSPESIDSNLALAGGASAILQKPISRAQLQGRRWPTLGLHAVARAHPHGPGRRRRSQGGRGDRRVPARAGLRGGARVRRHARRSSWHSGCDPDLILLDLMMPEVSGFDVVDALQREP